MRTYLKVFLVSLLFTSSAQAQLNNGDTAPNFTLTDLDGNSHHLYGYLDQGMAVYVKFFACHCPSCWAYHNTGTLEDLYTTYGPDGTDQIMVLMLEHDLNTTMDHFQGNHWYTQGDWITGNSIPIIDVADADRQVFVDYDINFYPKVIKICPDKTVEWVHTSLTTNDLYQKADDCPGELAIEEVSVLSDVNVLIDNGQLIVLNTPDQLDVSMVNMMGQKVQLSKIDGQNSYSISELEAGLYFVQIAVNDETVIKKIQIQ